MNIRREWLDDLLKIAGPVLSNLSEGTLRQKMPRDYHPDRAVFAPLEAFGRSLLGIAPWLEADSDRLHPEERMLQKVWREKALICIDKATDPLSSDYMVFDRGGQPLVDIAFLAHGLLRAPKALGAALEKHVRMNLIHAFHASRAIASFQSNWLFFTAMTEAALFLLGEEYDIMRLITALRCFQDWYLGDGVYGDGPDFHWDYYNSFVIQPMYVDIVNLMYDEHPEIREMRAAVNRRAARYASVLERMIGPEGSYPILGRSICYRFGAFQMLAQAALEHMLEDHLSPSGVRCALTAVIRRVMSSPDMFDAEGWLQPGVVGCQPELGEPYINTGSLYLCSAVFLPLGLTPEDPFWADPDSNWTGKTVWEGGHITIDHAID